VRGNLLLNSTEISFNEFLVRPRLKEGESLNGYVYRFYASNGLNVPEKVWVLLKQFYTQENSNDDLINQVKHLMKPTNLTTIYEWLDTYRSTTFIHYKRQRSLYTAEYRFCPACLKENNIYWSLWDLPMFTVCLKHRCKLIYICNQCNDLLRWMKLRTDWRCLCENDIREIPSQPEVSFQLRLSRLVLNASDSPQCSVYERQNTLDQEGSYTLHTLYAALEWAYFLKKKILYVKHPYLTKLQLDSLNYINKAKYGRWESRLLLHRLSSKRIEIILKRLTDKNPILTSILTRLRLLTVLTSEYLYIKTNKNIFTDSLIPLTHIFVKQYLIQIENELTLWVNHANIDTVRAVVLKDFHDWWHSVVSQNTNQLNEKSKKTCRNKFVKKVLQNKTESILKKLIYASQSPNSHKIYQSSLSGWNFPSSLGSSCIKEALLNELVNYLSRIKNNDLVKLYELVELTHAQLKDAQIA
jgi:hypothetical protein